MHLSPSYKLMFEGLPDPAGWARFLTYARRVRRITFEYSLNFPLEEISHEALEDMGMTRTTATILPSLTSLTWDCKDTVVAFDSVMFLHQGIREFIWYLPKVVRYSHPLSSFFTNVAARMPDLDTFELRSVAPLKLIQKDLLEFLPKLRKLRKLGLPIFYVTPEVAQTLATIPCLETIYYSDISSPSYGNSEDVEVFRPSLSSDSFPALKSLEIAVHTPEFHHMGSTWSMHNLTTLHLQEVTPLLADTALSVVTCICTQCPSLENLILDFRCSMLIADEQMIVDDDEVEIDMEPIDIKVIEPLFQMRHLQHFTISHDRVLELSHEDMDTIAFRFRNLKSIVLNPEPFVTVKSALTLGALNSLLRECPNIEEIGLYIDATQPAFDMLDIPEDKEVGRALKTLRFGTSYIEEVHSVANSLSKIVPVSCTVSHALQHRAHYIADWDLTTCSNRWKEVGEVAALLTTAREEERQRTRELQLEMERLRAQLTQATQR
ncbi:hypothetical protein GLOTRDRAFT_139964 [Gloeophyllum trabeum ATCC 11539]|uniref:F-box domain-containing protein n=1 Tax=Gloeophyllum trabeum (strain ATCC 11539 / FP-39264 / Madison 617) TaxID=670483 RepID=S7RFQ4_GLOTA|nr:uncharacterized protein GLOTRDRAFT_139964 [Gloeophyllum trabeum ATCC 11539]EPQ53005.1 hypothetical protein GLOTRDRAFT_139964 [Gloeophyllum trabeum ATCC 11539]